MMAKLTEMREKLISKKKDNKGFTLVELIVVIVILAILVGVTIGGVYGYVNKSRNNTDINNASAIASAMAPLTTTKGITVAADTKEIENTGIAAGSVTAESLGLTDGRTDKSVDIFNNMFPDGIPALKTDGAKYVITYTKDTDSHVMSVKVVATNSSGSPLSAQE